MKFTHSSVVAALLFFAAGAKASGLEAQAGVGAATVGPEWSVCVREVSGELLRCSLHPSAGTAGAQLLVERFTNEGARIASATEVHLPEVIDGKWIRGALDVHGAPGGGLIVAASFADGGDNCLRLWRIDLEQEPQGRRPVERVVSQAFARVLVPQVGPDGVEGEREYRFFEEPRLLVAGDSVSVLVSAIQVDQGVVVSDGTMLQLQLSPSLDSIVRADVLAQGSDPRVHGSDGDWWLSLRQLDRTDPEAPTFALGLLRSPDGRSWARFEAAPLHLPVQADYALGVAGGEAWIATPLQSDRHAVQLWRLDRFTQQWVGQGTIALASVGHSNRAESVWFPESGATQAARPLIAFPAATGLRALRW